MEKKFINFLLALRRADRGEPVNLKEIFEEFSGIHPDENLFWNVEGTDNAGFIIPIERYSDIGELYLWSEKLINGQREFLKEIMVRDAPEDLELDQYYPASKNGFFGCNSMMGLYSHYLKTFEGRCGFYGFRGCLNDYLIEREDGLYVRNIVLPDLCTEAWDNRFVLIYDVNDETASIIAALPETEKGSSETTYRFAAMRMIKGEKIWRLSDSSLFVS
ncbi:MAG: hypothetical protein NC394_07090 [Bacteroides sp.]|nr:hypothetical protein [Bacteroides sp.]